MFISYVYVHICSLERTQCYLSGLFWNDRLQQYVYHSLTALMVVLTMSWALRDGAKQPS